MGTKLVCYRFRKLSPSKRMMFHKELYGYKDFSNRGKYVYHRKGIINQIKHKKILDCVIVTNKDGAKELCKVLRKYHAKIFVFNISLPFKL